VTKELWLNLPVKDIRRSRAFEIADPKRGTEVLISIDAESKEEVDELLQKVVSAGGTIYGEPHDQGWMYGAGFVDLDGHRWNVLYMDMSSMPKEG